MSVCKQCGKDKSGSMWRLFLGWRNAKDAGTRKKDGYVPATPYAEACLTCVNLIPKRARRKTMGMLGNADGRVYFLEKYSWDEGGTIGFHNSDFYAVPQSVFYLSVKDVTRFLPKAAKIAQNEDQERTLRLARANHPAGTAHGRHGRKRILK